MILKKKIRLLVSFLLGLTSTNLFAGPVTDTKLLRQIQYPTGIKPPISTPESPKNELGIDEAAAYVSDLHTFWTYSSLHYLRFTEKGSFGGHINSSNRFGETAVQYELDAYPTLFKGAYAELNFDYAKKSQILFPSYQYHAESYFTLPLNLQFSLGQGGQIFPQFSNHKIFAYTSSLGKYFGNYFLWVRPYYYTPESNQFYEVGLRKTFSDPNGYVTLRINAGNLPDIGDLPPLDNLITIKQKGISLIGQFPVKQNLFLRCGVEYDRQVFPSKLVRNVTTGYLSVFLRF